MRSLALILALFAPTALAEDATRFGAELASLRTEVETLNQDIALDKETLRSKLRSFESTEADLLARIREEELTLSQLQLEAAQEKEKTASATSDAGALLPAVDAGVTALRPLIEHSLPFRTADRLAALEDIETKAKAGTLAPHKAISRLWQFAEDELRLSRENALDRQVIKLGGQEVLAETARVGMVALYFRTEDGRYGWAERSGDSWTWATTDSSADHNALDVLFDSLDKQIRVGWFELPHAVPGAN